MNETSGFCLSTSADGTDTYTDICHVKSGDFNPYCYKKALTGNPAQQDSDLHVTDYCSAADHNEAAPDDHAEYDENTSTDGSKDASVKTQDSAASRSAPSRGSISGNGLAQGEELVQGPRSAASKTAVAAGAAPKLAAKTEVKPDPKVEPRPEPKAEPKPHPVPSPEPSNAARQDDAARAKALLEGRAAGLAVANAEESRFIVQVGAFADNDKAREVRAKLERAGLKTYTQVVDTKDGKRTRVRVGPFANRAEADKAVARIKGLDLPASVLTL